MSPIKKLIKPDVSEFILYIGVGFALLVLNNIQKLWAYLTSGVDLNEVLTYSDIAFEIQQKLLDFEAGIDPRFVDFTVWMIIGAFSITTVFIAQKVLGDSGEEIKRARMLRKTRFGRVVKQETAYRFALRIAGLVLFLMWIRIYFGAFFSSLSSLFFESMTDLLSYKIIFIPITVILAGIGIYIFAICARLIALKIRVFS